MEPSPLNSPSSGASETSVIRRARDGDESAFEELYRTHVGRVYALCLRLSGDPLDAEEFVQRAFVRAWEHLHAFRGDSAFGTWLHRLTVNEVLQEHRSASRRSRFLASVADVDEVPARARIPQPGVKIDLEQAISRLPTGARMVFVLHDVEGYTHEEIGKISEISPGTSKAQLHRARRLLRVMLE